MPGTSNEEDRKSSISRLQGKNLHKDQTESKPELKTKKKMTEDT